MTRERSAAAPLVFTSSYLLTWGSAGVVAFVVSGVGGRMLGDVLVWDRAGRWVAAGILLTAAVYELTPMKPAGIFSSARGATGSRAHSGWE
jgi:predicted metal-binding membrane protein